MARALAPDGHVFEDAGVVADDLEPVSCRELHHLAHREQDRQRAEGAGHVELAGDGSGHGTLLVAGSLAKAAPYGARDGSSSVE
jgi:hypothetical protein